jgi:serine/threonine-protein kinase
MKPDDLWEELKRRRVVRVALAYAAVVFLALQVADLTFDPLGLPAWSYRFLLIVSLIGFPVAVALAWAFDVGPGGVVRDSEDEPEQGRADRPRTAMGRLVVGAAATVAVLIGVWQFGGRALPAGAEGVDNELIAVIPFRVAATDDRVTILREGVIDMLGPIFSASPRIVDSGAMISAWRRASGAEGSDLSEGQAVELARSLGAGRVIVGSIVGDGDAFAMNARLLRVPGGDLVGDASVDGSSAELREVVSQMAAQILSMEAGVDRGQVDFLDDVPLEALDAYLEGRNAYRRSAYFEARGAFARALDADSTFALAALGAREAVDMGLDADRFDLGARASRLLAANLDRLPPREREFAQLWLGATRLSAVELVRERGSEMVSRLPDKAEAWYLYGDWLYHASLRVAEPDWEARAMDAFERALELDPGLEVAREHLFYRSAFSGDTAAAARASRSFLERAGHGEMAVVARTALAYLVDDSTQRTWVLESLDTLSYVSASMVAFTAEVLSARMPAELVDRAFDQAEAVAIAEEDREQVLALRHAYLRSAGRQAEADAQLRLLESAFGPRPRDWVEAALYWDGLGESAEAAVAELERRTAGDEPLEWFANGRDACALELWRLNRGDVSGAARTIRRLRDGSDDLDPRHGRSAICALTLEAMAAERSGSPDADRLLDELVDVLDQGPYAALTWTSLEAAWMLERRGEFAAAARVAGYQTNNQPFAFAASTIHREAARLHDLAGNTGEAARRYGWYLTPRLEPDDRLRAETDSIRARVAVLDRGG